MNFLKENWESILYGFVLAAFVLGCVVITGDIVWS